MLCIGFDLYVDAITLGFDEKIELGCSDRYVGDCNYVNLESLVIGFQDGINYGVVDVFLVV